MTYAEMLKEIELIRLKGLKVSITGNNADGWRCEIDKIVGKGKTPVDAYLQAKMDIIGD